jgi:Protein of unknown function (DUF551)
MEWISVEERLPEREKEVIIYEKYTSIPIIAWLSWSGNWHSSKDHLSINGDGSIDDNIENKFVTHWMPLPEPPIS